MKNLAKNIFLFALVSVMLYVSLFFLLNTITFQSVPVIYLTANYFEWKGGKTYQSFKEFRKEQQYDAIILGSSHARTGIDPRIFKKHGYSVFNLGTKMQSMINTYYIVKNYVTKENCKLLILDVIELPFCSDAFESSSDLIQNISSSKAAAEMAYALKDIRSLNLLTLRFINSNKGVMLYDSTYVENGFCERTDSVKTKLDYTEKPFLPNKMQIAYFEKTIELLKTRNINVVLIDAPMSSGYKQQYHKDFLKIIKPIIDKYNIPFIDYSSAHSLDINNHFYDNIHLNQSGAEIFNPILMADLLRLNLLTKKSGK